MHRHRYFHRKTKHDQIQLILQESVPLELRQLFFYLFLLVKELNVQHLLMHFVMNYTYQQYLLMVGKIYPYTE